MPPGLKSSALFDAEDSPVWPQAPTVEELAQTLNPNTEQDMNTEPEPISAVLAEMRREARSGEHADGPLIEDFADRIEKAAALERDKARIEAQSDQMKRATSALEAAVRLFKKELPTQEPTPTPPGTPAQVFVRFVEERPEGIQSQIGCDGEENAPPLTRKAMSLVAQAIAAALLVAGDAGAAERAQKLADYIEKKGGAE